MGLQQPQASIENWGHKELKEMKMTWIVSLSAFEQNSVNPFNIGQYEGKEMPLINIAASTGAVAHLKFRNRYSVLRSKAKGQWESLSKANI